MKKYVVFSVFAFLTFFFAGMFSFKFLNLVSAEDNGGWSEWSDTSSCISSECGTSVGTKNQERTKSEEVCDTGCPTLSFSASRQVCPEDASLYTSDDSEKLCDMTFGEGRNKYKKYADKITETFGPIDVVYGIKSEDPHKCHKPTASSLDIPSWAVNDYNEDNNTLPDWKDEEQINCRQVVSDTETRSVSCDNAPVVSCGSNGNPTPNGDVCANIDGIQTSVPNDYHLDASGRNCVQFSVPGSENSSTAVSTGSVLGASTMAKTGVVEDSLFYSMFTFGSLLTSLGIMKNGKKRN